MSKAHRIAAGGLVFRGDEVLLVRYRDVGGGTYLVGSGGALSEYENVVQAIVRETAEETGINYARRTGRLCAYPCERRIFDENTARNTIRS